jgi:hypothetical protein
MLVREPLISLLDRSKKRIIAALALAVLVHLPVTPVLPVLRMVHRLSVKNRELEQPIKPVAPPEVEVQLERAIQQEQRHQEQVHASAQAEPEGPSASLAMTPPQSVPFNQASPPETPPDENPIESREKKEKEKLKDIGLEGDLAKKDDTKPGVSLGLWLSSLRDNPLGKELVRIATCDRQWRGFVEQGIDLLNDFDGVLVVGPSLNEPGALTAAVRHSLPEERVHQVVDGLVKRSGKNGKWLEPSVATARFGKDQRVLMPHQKDLFFMTPSKGWRTLHELKHPMKVPASEGRLASIVLSKPNETLKNAGLMLPKRISSLRLEVYAYPDQSGDIKLELDDVDSKAADEDVEKVSKLLSDFFSDAWTLASTFASFAGVESDSQGPELAPRLNLVAKDSTMSGTIRLTPRQTRRTVSLVSSLLCRKSKPNAKRKP